MSESVKAAIISAIISGIFGTSSVFLAYYLNHRNAEQIEKLNKEVFKPTILIDAPDKEQKSDLILPVVNGFVKGNIPANYEILVGHRELSEQKIKIHVDRVGTILSDKSFKVEDIYLGSEKYGAGKTFEIIVLLVGNTIIDDLKLKDGDNPLECIPENIAKATTIVMRN